MAEKNTNKNITELDPQTIAEIAEYEKGRGRVSLDKRFDSESPRNFAEAVRHMQRNSDEGYLSWYEKVRYDVTRLYEQGFEVKAQGRKNLVFFNKQHLFSLNGNSRQICRLQKCGNYVIAWYHILAEDGSLEPRISLFQKDGVKYKQLVQNCKEVSYDAATETLAVKFLCNTKAPLVLSKQRPSEKEINKAMAMAKATGRSISHYTSVVSGRSSILY